MKIIDIPVKFPKRIKLDSFDIQNMRFMQDDIEYIGNEVNIEGNFKIYSIIINKNIFMYKFIIFSNKLVNWNKHRVSDENVDMVECLYVEVHNCKTGEKRLFRNMKGHMRILHFLTKTVYVVTPLCTHLYASIFNPELDSYFIDSILHIESSIQECWMHNSFAKFINEWNSYEDGATNASKGHLDNPEDLIVINSDVLIGLMCNNVLKTVDLYRSKKCFINTVHLQSLLQSRQQDELVFSKYIYMFIEYIHSLTIENACIYYFINNDLEIECEIEALFCRGKYDQNEILKIGYILYGIKREHQKWINERYRIKFEYVHEEISILVTDIRTKAVIFKDYILVPFVELISPLLSITAVDSF